MIPEKAFMGDLTHERKGQVCVRVDAARDNILAFSIYNCRSRRGLCSAVSEGSAQNGQWVPVCMQLIATAQSSVKTMGHLCAFNVHTYFLRRFPDVMHCRRAGCLATEARSNWSRRAYLQICVHRGDDAIFDQHIS